MTTLETPAPTEALKLSITVDDQGVTDHLKTSTPGIPVKFP